MRTIVSLVELSHTWLKNYFWLFIYVFKYLFNVLCVHFLLSVMRVVSVSLQVLCSGSGCSRKMTEAYGNRVVMCKRWMLTWHWNACWVQLAVCYRKEKNSLSSEKEQLLRWPLARWVCEATRKKGSVGWQLGGADELLKVYWNDPVSLGIWCTNISFLWNLLWTFPGDKRSWPAT